MTAPGWYPDSSGQQRYFDGQQWTAHVAPVQAAAPPHYGETVTVSGPNHALHALVSLFTCGFWLPVWLVIAILDSKKVRIQRF